jgi:diaminohydroxyphosphoribosylaminopyrimidine deaminase/5-amino-6-(5-phosphoribosylamino)uracil reductase
VHTIAEAIDLDYTEITQVGPDLRFTAVPRKREG